MIFVFSKTEIKFEKVDPHFWGFFEKWQKMTFLGGSKKGSFFRILVPFFGLSVGIPALKKWGGYPIFRSILRRGDTPFLGVKKWPFFGGPKNGLFWGLIFRPKSKNQACFWICISRKMFQKKPTGVFFGTRYSLTTPAYFCEASKSRQRGRTKADVHLCIHQHNHEEHKYFSGLLGKDLSFFLGSHCTALSWRTGGWGR